MKDIETQNSMLKIVLNRAITELMNTTHFSKEVVCKLLFNNTGVSEREVFEATDAVIQPLEVVKELKNSINDFNDKLDAFTLSYVDLYKQNNEKAKVIDSLLNEIVDNKLCCGSKDCTVIEELSADNEGNEKCKNTCKQCWAKSLQYNK